MPSERNVAVDSDRKITYVFMAYRKMTEYEVLMGVQMLWQQRKKPKRNTTITVMTNHGAVG